MLNRRMCAIVLALLLLLPGVRLGAEGTEFTGKVLEVLEGDLLRIAHGDKAELVRLHGLDCPEMKQPFGPEAKKFTSALALGNEVRVEVLSIEPKNPKKKRLEDRLIAKVTLPEGTTLTQEILIAGMGWWNRDDKPLEPVLGSLCAKAITTKKGLWVDPAPLAPWDFRAAQKEAEDAGKPAQGTEKDQAPGQPQPGRRLSRAEASVTVFITRHGSSYHHSGCVHLDRSRKPITRGQAEALGYTPCPLCFPPKPEEETPALAQKGNLEYVPPLEFPEYRDNAVYKQLQPRWHRDGDGKVNGISADNLSSNPIAAMLGFQDGDVLQSVNGQRITSEAQIRELAERYKDTKTFSVGIVRDGRPQTLNITIPF